MIKLTCEGRIVPKKRPIVNTKSKQGVLPENYRKWKNAAIIYLGRQWEHLHGNEVILQAEIKVIFYGDQHGDPDNLVGSILDAMVQSNILDEDKIFNIPLLIVKHEPSNPLGCDILIKPLQWKPKELTLKVEQDLNNVF